VAGLAAGQSRQVTLRLPVAAMQIVSVSTSQPSAFDKLMVAVDTDNSIEETDKSNNVAVVDRDALEAR
jgi:subtilase family serine protease